jgi:hypothetical protein
MIAALERNEESASRPGRFLPPWKTGYPLHRRLGGPQGRSGHVRKISPPSGFDPPDRPVRRELLYRLSYRAHRLYYAPAIFFSVLAFGFNQKQKSINFIRRHFCQSTWSVCPRNPHDNTVRIDALFKKSLRAVNTSESIRFIRSECFGDSLKLCLKRENVGHSENSVQTTQSQNNFTRNLGKLWSFEERFVTVFVKTTFLPHRLQLSTT